MEDSKEGEFRTQILNVISELIETKSDRAVGVLGGALVDDNLKLAITPKWRVGDTEIIKKANAKLIGAGGVMTFTVKIDFAYLTGMIGPETHSDLARIKDIRNAFAHRTLMNNNHKLNEPVTFKTQAIASWCNNLKASTKISATVQKAGSTEKTSHPISSDRERFLGAVFAYSLALLVYSENPDAELTVLNNFLSR